MILFKQKRRLIALLSCIAVFFSALAPAVSHALAAHGDHQAWMVVCSASGSKYMPLPLETAAPAKKSPEKSMDMAHCLYCSMHAHTPAFIIGNAPKLLSGNLSYELPELYYHAPQPLFAWASSNPRAPPANS
ncbi:DUF2946 domain-containing protein [Methylobacillus caricis]|uniref:DUF2946 domain-containing protein n=1 Tax=Methylobacillus caricis TaxID=1971611 RepID=UPI001CFF5A4B|nr:DUF2946 domain-containing protein [Methylobacillus caricis]MCB5188511.1 DUF2946 domain-containing protein [Methylobacillus caricis]